MTFVIIALIVLACYAVVSAGRSPPGVSIFRPVNPLPFSGSEGNKSSIAAKLLAGLAIVAAISVGGSTLRQATPVPPAAGPDMVKAFASNDDRAEALAHAHAMETILGTIADVLEYDGRRPEPRVKSATQVEDLRFALREYRMGGWSFGHRYPDLKAELDRYFAAQVGEKDHKLDPAKRELWVRAFRVARDNCRYARERG